MQGAKDEEAWLLPCPLVAQLFHHRPPSRTAELSGDKLPILTAGAYASDRADLRTWAELATLEEAARFAGRMRPFRQVRKHWDFGAELLLKAAQTKEESDIEMATAQMERALRVEGWL